MRSLPVYLPRNGMDFRIVVLSTCEARIYIVFVYVVAILIERFCLWEGRRFCLVCVWSFKFCICKKTWSMPVYINLHLVFA